MSTQHIDPIIAADSLKAGIVPLAAYDATTDYVIDLRGVKEKALLVLNTGANTVVYQVLGSLDAGAAYDLIVKADTNVLTAAQDLFRNSEYCTHWKVRVKAAAASTATIKFAGLGA
jgi:uncharacterized protein YgiM (DUF1202 family)